MHWRVHGLLVSIGGALLLIFGWHAAPNLAGGSLNVGSVIISEVAWGGTAAGVQYEWLELHNVSDGAISLNGWELSDAGDITINLNGTINAKGYYLLERFDDAVSDVPADSIYFGVLDNGGESLTLRNDAGIIVDTANGNGGPWPAGEGAPGYLSMERLDQTGADVPANWVSNDAITRNGIDVNGGPINGTPGQPNSRWSVIPDDVDLSLAKTGPNIAPAGSQIRYTLAFRNDGPNMATGVIVSDTLPNGLEYHSDDSQFPLSQPSSGTLNWQVGTVPGGTQMSFHVTATIGQQLAGIITNLASIDGNETDTDPINNDSQAETLILDPGESLVLIDALYYDSYESGDLDEAIRLLNIGAGNADLSGWKLGDGESDVIFPAGATLPVNQGIWVAREGTAFTRQFGFVPDFEARPTDVSVPDMTGSWRGYNNAGDEVILRDKNDSIVDVLVYKDGDTSLIGWTGVSVQPYKVLGVFGEEGQILYRMKQQINGMPVADTDTAVDWAQSSQDIINGRRVRYPGWDLEEFFLPPQITETGTITIAIAPDNAYDFLIQEIKGAKSSIRIEAHSLTSIAIAEALSEVAASGVELTILLEGSPVTGIDDLERYACQMIETAGGACWFMISDSQQDIYDRYRYLHAKFLIIDDQRVILSTENLSPYSLPNDPKADGTWGRRGILFATNAAEVVDRFRQIWERDFDPNHHVDLFRWTVGDPTYGGPPAGMVPITITGGITYTVRYTAPSSYQGTFRFEVVQSPENSLRSIDGLLNLVNSAGAGDTILAEQLEERPHWGSSSSDAGADPNPRLESYLDAARRGASVRLLLDQFFDGGGDGSLNAETCQIINTAASIERLDIRCALANPTGLGIHNKMIVMNIGGNGYIFIGSLNGTELSHKGNREVALLVQSNEAYTLLANMFKQDWPTVIRLPVIFNRYVSPADYVLISEVLYDPSGREDAEFIELVNPTQQPIDLTGFSLGDAKQPTDFEDLRHFPTGALIQPLDTIVVALTASGFHSDFGFYPDYEILDSNPGVPNMIDDPDWGDPDAILQLGNGGDEVLLRDPVHQLVDAIAYGSGNVPGNVSCPLLGASDHSLERYPYWQDTDGCTVDFRDWPLPGPGLLP